MQLLSCRETPINVTSSPMLRRKRVALVLFAARSTPVVQLRSMHGVSAWKGLELWRSAPIDERRAWGKNAPVIQLQKPLLDGGGGGGGGGLELPTATGTSWNEAGSTGGRAGGVDGNELEIGDLASWGALVLATTDPLQKAWLTHEAFCLWTKGQLELGVAIAPDAPGRPLKPELVPPRQVPSPKDCALSPSAHMLHNLAHIELNAIDLAWDTVVRFSYASQELGVQFFADFLHVADDESRHFRWCSQRLNELGFSYGDMPAHNLLWQDCLRTSGNVRSRLAVIPMMQEARGLDAGPRLVKRLLGLDDHRSAAIVRRIGQEEVAHVGVGVFHFLRICEKLGVDPGAEFKELMVECNIELHGPFNHKARELAGLQRDWYDRSDPKESAEGEVKSQRTSLLKENSENLARDPEGKEQRSEMSSSGTTSKQSQESSKVEERPTVVQHGSLTERKGDYVPDKSNSGSSSSVLPEVYERLALLVAVEKDNAGT